ncbi:MAG: aminotransferase class I/II-fold pyridoxal phosphate-dependent enzyme [Clostridiales bacterium]|nr:aminotransferase class I/II-fold pyridoxal phosphate-dependent enzyme [Clostridiales bacterium]
MKYDFTTMVDRRGKDSLAANEIPYEEKTIQEGLMPIPMWVADMSFPVAPPVLEAIHRRLEFPSFGYFRLSEAYFESIINWQRSRNGVEGLLPEHIGYENGVLGGVSAAVSAFTTPGDCILLHSPTYIGFTETIHNMGRKIIHSELVRDGDGIWRMNYEDMDAKIKAHHIHFAVFCSPHNPCGRVWERWEIEKAMEVYAANDCVVVSDEIWSDIIMPGYRHIPTQSVSEDAWNRTIAFYSVSKTFSLAGLVGSYHIAYNSYLRDRLTRQGAVTRYNEPNVLSMHGHIGGLSDAGAEWVDQMCRCIEGNFERFCSYLREEVPEVKTMHPQGTYMLFLDCGEWCKKHGVSIHELQMRGVRAGVIWSNGEMFMYPDSIRMNLALPLEMLDIAVERLRKYVFI